MQALETSITTKWSIDKVHSQIGFSVKYLLFTTVRGTFGEFDAKIYTMQDDFTKAEIDFWVDASSIDTGVKQRNEHLRNADFFDTELYKEIRFRSDWFVKTDNPENVKLHGELTIKGVSRHVVLEVKSGGIIKDPWGAEKALFSITGKINRKDWGLNWNSVLETGGLLVSEEVGIHCEVLLIRQPD